MKEIHIERDSAPEIWFDGLLKAKRWMCNEIVEFSINFDPMTYGYYLNVLMHAKSLKELADIWNAYTDLFMDGSQFIVKEIYFNNYPQRRKKQC